MNHHGQTINYDKYHDESKARAQRLSKLPDDGDRWAQNNVLTPEQTKKHLSNPGGASNRQEAPVPTN